MFTSTMDVNGNPLFFLKGAYVEHEGVHCEPRSKNTYNRTNWVCCSNHLKPRLKDAWRTSCCGTETYDSKRFICCGGNLQVKTNRKQMCCGNKTYNPEHFVCCDGHLNYARETGRSRRRRNVCCGKWTYDPREQICCSGQINARTSAIRWGFPILFSVLDATTKTLISRYSVRA